MSTFKIEKKAGYHHGGLREALVEAGLAILSEGGDPAALSLREAARRAGVSAMAPYRHFPDKEALLGAVAAVGFERLTARLEAADAGAAAGAELIDLGAAYFDFALAKPALFRLMFGATFSKPECGGSPEGGAAFAVMARRVATMTAPQEHAIVALHCWALVHGLAALALDGKIDPDPSGGLVRGALAITVRGLAARGLAARGSAATNDQNGTALPSQAKKPPLSEG